MANGIGGNDAAVEMHAFDKRVDAHDLDAVAFRLDHGRIIADADKDPVRIGREPAADAGDEIALGDVADDRGQSRIIWHSRRRASRESP